MNSAFDRDTALERLQDGGFSAELSASWRAGRGPHGGYLAAILLRALTETVADPSRAPRSLTVHYPSAPRPGAVRIHTRIERQGNSLSTLSARMEQDGRLMALALSVFSVPWSAPEAGGVQMPELPGPDPQRISSRLIQGAPPFTENLVMQPRVGSVPFQGSDGPMEIGGWTGLIDPRAIDAISLAMFADAWFPPVFIALDKPAMAPTVDLTVHFREPSREVSDPAELCLAIFRTRLLHQGFFEEDGVIWALDGTVLAQSRQLGILIGAGERPRAQS